MEALPRRQAHTKPAPRPKKAKAAAATVALPDAVVNAVIKIAAAGIMSSLADAAEELKAKKS